MKTVSLTVAKRDLDALLDQVERGEEFEITRWGKPIARLIAEPASPGEAEALPDTKPSA